MERSHVYPRSSRPVNELFARSTRADVDDVGLFHFRAGAENAGARGCSDSRAAMTRRRIAAHHVERSLRRFDHARLLEPCDLRFGEPEYLAHEPVVVLTERRRVRAFESAAVVWQPVTVAFVPPPPEHR